jgi:hypothetical protein
MKSWSIGGPRNQGCPASGALSSMRPAMFQLRKILLVPLLVGGSLLPFHGQGKPAPSTHTATLLVDTDDSCRLLLDGADQGVINPDRSKKIEVGFGEHVVKCTIETVPDLVWRKAIVVKTADQIAALVALKALHIQYDQAVAQRNQAATAQEKHQSDVAALEQNRINARKRPTLEATLKFVVDSINSVGTFSYDTTAELSGGVVHYSTSATMSDARASLEQCTLSWIYTDDPSVGKDKIRMVWANSLRLKEILNVGIFPLSRVPGADASTRFSPEPYLIVITTTTPQAIHWQHYKKGKLDKDQDVPQTHEWIYFSDMQLATRVGKAIGYASGLCGGSQTASEF